MIRILLDLFAMLTQVQPFAMQKTLRVISVNGDQKILFVSLGNLGADDGLRAGEATLLRGTTPLKPERSWFGRRR